MLNVNKMAAELADVVKGVHKKLREDLKAGE